MPFRLETAVRPNILALKPYRCARDDYSVGILLDANENSRGPAIKNTKDTVFAFQDAQLERYPDPHQADLKSRLAQFRGLPSPDHFFLGVGSDESIDLAIRVFCVPGKEKILICPPTYGMYSVCAHTNDVEVVKVPLITGDGGFQLNVEEIVNTLGSDPLIKIVFLCSPGNPTGSLLKQEDIRAILEVQEYNGIVLVDEAYIDFCDEGASVANWVLKYPNLAVIQTLSKSFGLAGIRLGISISSTEIAAVFNKTKAPYNISTPTSQLALAAVSDTSLSTMKENVRIIKSEREKLANALLALPFIGRILGNNDANFVLAQFVDSCGRPDNNLAFLVYKNLAEGEQVVVRFRGTELGCEGCLRITIGTETENAILLEKIAKVVKDIK